MTGSGWGQDPFGGSPFGDDPFGGGPASGGPAGGGPVGGGPPPMFVAPPPPPPHGGREANTLATLSVVFAFLFAPAGAVLGHLGLRRIARTGERGRERALVGIALSYGIIVMSVVVLVAWMVAGRDSQDRIAAPTRTNAPSGSPPPGSSPTSAPTKSQAPIALPPLNAGRTVDAPDLPALLLGVEQVKPIMADGTDAQPVPNLTARPPTTALEPTPGGQGTMTDAPECAPAMIAGSEAGYRDSGYRAAYSVTMSQPGPAGAQAVTQSVIAFPDPATAQRALLGILETVQRCAVRQTKGQADGYFEFTEPDGGVAGSWGCTALNLEPHGDGIGNEFYQFDNLRFKPKSPPRLFYVTRRALGLKGNAVVDIAVRGLGIYGQDWDIISEILKKLT